MDINKDILLKCGGKSKIQAILFNNKKFDTTSARSWLKRNNFKPIKRVDKTKNLLRYRIIEPIYNQKYIYRVIPFSKNIKAVIIIKK